MRIFTALLNLLFPPKCVFCKKLLHSTEFDWCDNCTEALPYTEFERKLSGDYFDYCIAPLYYKGAARDSLIRFKFRNAPIYAEAFGKMLSECIKEHSRSIPDFDIITWVPLSAKRKKQRGYDQAELLAKATAAQLERSAAEVLIKPLDCRPQSELSGASDRRANIDGAFDIIDSDFVKNKVILLIDDIITTGATLSECAKILREAGASKVICACMCMRESE